MATQFVTLVAQGGTPIRLADQRGTPYPTTGSGSLVFANSPTLINPILQGATIDFDFPITVPTLTVTGDFTAETGVLLAGSTSGETRLIASAVAAGVVTLPSNTTHLVGTDTTNTLINKTINGPDNTITFLQPSSFNDGIDADATTFWRGDGTWAIPAFDLTIGTTAIVGANDGSVLYNATGLLGQYAITGTGDVVMSDAPGLTGLVTITGTQIIDGGTVVADTIPLTITQAWNNAAVNFSGFRLDISNGGSHSDSRIFRLQVSTSDVFAVDTFGTVITSSSAFFGDQVQSVGEHIALNATAIPAGGVVSGGYMFSSVANYGMFFGSGVPTLSAAQGSLYLRSDGLPYYNTNGTTGWDRLAGLASANTFTALQSGPGTLSNLVIRTQPFPASGTYTPNTNMVYCQLECWGGAGGGAGQASAGATIAQGGGGGGAGGYSRTMASKAAIGASQTVTLGAAGTAGTNAPTAGGNGGDTSIGSLCIGKGGTGGATSGNSGAGGVAGTGDLTGIGMPGGIGTSGGSQTVSRPGVGGDSLVGAGGRPTGGGAATYAGTAGSGFASGGSGGQSYNAGGAVAGGAGTAGYAFVTEWCTA